MSRNAIEAQWRKTDPERFGTEIARFWRVYSRRYLSEMRRQRPLIEWLSALERDFGLMLTVLCACHDHRLCHRSLLADLIAESPPAGLEADDFKPPDPLGRGRELRAGSALLARISHWWYGRRPYLMA